MFDGMTEAEVDGVRHAAQFATVRFSPWLDRFVLEYPRHENERSVWIAREAAEQIEVWIDALDHLFLGAERMRRPLPRLGAERG